MSFDQRKRETRASMTPERRGSCESTRELKISSAQDGEHLSGTVDDCAILIMKFQIDLDPRFPEMEIWGIDVPASLRLPAVGT